MSKEMNIAAQKKFGEAVNTGQFELFNDLVAEILSTMTPPRGRFQDLKVTQSFLG